MVNKRRVVKFLLSRINVCPECSGDVALSLTYLPQSRLEALGISDSNLEPGETMALLFQARLLIESMLKRGIRIYGDLANGGLELVRIMGEFGALPRGILGARG